MQHTPRQRSDQAAIAQQVALAYAAALELLAERRVFAHAPGAHLRQRVGVAATATERGVLQEGAMILGLKMNDCHSMTSCICEPAHAASHVPFIVQRVVVYVCLS